MTGARSSRSLSGAERWLPWPRARTQVTRSAGGAGLNPGTTQRNANTQTDYQLQVEVQVAWNLQVVLLLRLHHPLCDGVKPLKTRLLRLPTSNCGRDKIRDSRKWVTSSIVPSPLRL